MTDIFIACINCEKNTPVRKMVFTLTSITSICQYCGVTNQLTIGGKS